MMNPEPQAQHRWLQQMLGDWTCESTCDGEPGEPPMLLTLETEGPSFTGDGRTAKYRDTITLLGPNERTLTSTGQQPDGGWKEFMKATYRRKTA